MFCQACGAYNSDDQEYCNRCHQKLLVLSGGGVAEETGAAEEDTFSFDEHLLERISILEEAVKRTAEMMRQILEGIRRQERNILINSTGLASLQDLLDQKRQLGREEWRTVWEATLNTELQALERRDRFVAIHDRVSTLFRGERREAFLELLELAENAFYSLETGRALEALEQALRLDRSNLELAYFLGESYFNEGLTDRALPHFLHLLEASPDHYEGLVYSAVIFHELGESQRAEEHLRRAVGLYPDIFLPHFALGAIYAERGELQEAVGCLEQAVIIDPVPQALFLLGNALYELGKPTAAIRRLREAVRRDPSFEEAYHLLGLAYLERRWNRLALDAFRQAQRLNPRKMRYSDVVRYLSGEGRTPLPAVTGDARDWLAAGEEKLSREDTRGGLTCYRQALACDPENPTLLMSYALLCLELDRTQEIEAVSRQVIAQEPGEMLKATACAALMEALRSQGKFREGERIGQGLLDEGKSRFTKTIAYYEMACNQAEMEEDLDRALDYAQRSLENAPDELKQFPLAALGWIHYKRKEFDQAVDFLAKSTEIGPSSTTLTHLGMALLASGQEEQARDAFAHARTLSDRGEALGAKMMEFMKDSARLLERVRRGQRK